MTYLGTTGDVIIETGPMTENELQEQIKIQKKLESLIVGKGKYLKFIFLKERKSSYGITIDKGTEGFVKYPNKLNNLEFALCEGFGVYSYHEVGKDVKLFRTNRK